MHTRQMDCYIAFRGANGHNPIDSAMINSSYNSTHLAPAHIRVRLSKWLVPMLLLISMLAFNSGCSSLRLPRIDPTGSSIFLPPSNTTTLLGPLQSASAGLPQVNQPLSSLPLANQQPPVAQQTPSPTLQAPVVPNRNPFLSASGPAFQQAAVPPPCDGGGCSTRTKHKKLTPNPNRKLKPGQAGQMLMTPSRIVAPVGSEVVVIAGICGSDGFFSVNQPLEWILSNDSVGQFVEIGGMQHPTFNKLVRPSSRKFDGQYAWGRTGLKPQILSRGTPTPVDDIELRKGQTFVTVSSVSPGTSYVTGVAPKAEGWDRRKASTVIHWIDGTWSIPTPTQATAGTVTALTTLITDTEGRGLKDWPVRYSIVGGAPAEFAPAGSQTAEAKSNTDGQATVQIRQPAGQFEPGKTQVRVDVVRPSVFGQPELVVESGLTTIDWSAPALTIRAIGPRATEQGSPFSYRVEVTNPGDQTARNVIVRTKDLDDSIEFISSNPKPTEYGRQYEWNIGDVVAGAPAKIVDMQLKSDKLGNVGLCFEVISQEDRLQTEACAETEIVQPCINLVIEGPSNAQAGDQVTYLLRVENRCDQPLENIQMNIAYDPGLVRPGQSNPAIIGLADNGLMQVNQSETFTFTAIAQGTGQQCLNVTITADGVRPERKTACVVVSSNSSDDGTPISEVPNFGSGSSDSLGLNVSAARPITSAGPNGQPETISRVEVDVINRSNQAMENVTLFAAATDSLTLISMTNELIPNIRSQEGNELLIALPRIEPGQTTGVTFGYGINRDDPNANVLFSVASPTGGTASQRVSVSTTPAANVPGNGANPRTGDPNFGPSGIVIPSDSAVGGPTVLDREPVEVSARFAQRTVQAGGKVEYQFSITNNTTQPLTLVDVDFIVPNSLTITNFRASDGSRLTSPTVVQRIFRMEPGQTIDFAAETTASSLPGPATMEVRVRSNETPLAVTATDQVVVN